MPSSLLLLLLPLPSQPPPPNSATIASAQSEPSSPMAHPHATSSTLTVHCIPSPLTFRCWQRSNIHDSPDQGHPTLIQTWSLPKSEHSSSLSSRATMIKLWTEFALSELHRARMWDKGGRGSWNLAWSLSAWHGRQRVGQQQTWRLILDLVIVNLELLRWWWIAFFVVFYLKEGRIDLLGLGFCLEVQIAGFERWGCKLI